MAETVAITLSFMPFGGVNVHFINKIKGEYVDHTLGYLSKANTYYVISEHTLEDLADVRMDKLLNSTKADVINGIFSKEEELGITNRQYYL